VPDTRCHCGHRWTDHGLGGCAADDEAAMGGCDCTAPARDPLDIPYHDIPDGIRQTFPGATLAGGLVVKSVVLDVVGLGPTPGLSFEFRDDQGDMRPPILLVLDDKAMAATAAIVDRCVRRAVDVARQHRARRN
jgi:hypothetical protein